KRYGDRRLKLVSAVIIFIFLIPYSASVYNGLSSLFEIVFGIDGWIVMLALAALTALYLFFGGYFATALSDFIQGIIMIIGVGCMFFCFMNSAEVNWDISKIANDINLTWFTFNAENKGIYGSTVSLLSLMFLTSFGVWALPQTIHKYYAIRDKKAIYQGVVVSTAFAMIIGVVAYFTGALSAFFPETSGVPHAEVIPTMISLVIPAGLTGVIAVLILSASMSTLSSVSLAGASVMAIDVYGNINKKANDKKVNIVMKTLCLLFIIISVVLAILNEKYGITAIAYMMGISWGTLAGCFIGPYVLGVTWKKVTKPAVWTSIISSLVLTVALIIIFGLDKNGWSAPISVVLKDGVATSPLIGVICMAFSMIITPIVSLLTKKTDDSVIYEAFDKPLDGEIK
ncbi:MAG: sodium:solute symporter family protein, partial [Clostridia bacterium]|nr:sodium:solute symporter family protein [Clostridia bacterium]